MTDWIERTELSPGVEGLNSFKFQMFLLLALA